MEINTNSWHYKVVNFASIEMPKSLCSYFWTLVGALIFGLVIIYDIVLVSIFLITKATWFELLMIIGAVIIILMILSTVIVLVFLIRKFFKNRHKDEPIKKSEGLLASWIKARKSRMCPMVDYVNHERN